MANPDVVRFVADPWTIGGKLTTRSVCIFELVGPGGRTAKVRCERNGGTVATSFVVTFTKPTIGSQMHAFADAARCYAVICDTIGDLADEDPIDCDRPCLLGDRVEVHGEGGILALSGFFGMDTFEDLVEGIEFQGPS